MTTPIRVAIADDHGITRAALRRFVAAEDDMVVAGEAWDGRSAVELARTRRPDVLLLDLMMPGQGGIDALAMIRVKSPRTGVLVFTACPESHFAVDVMRRGARGFLGKQCDPQEIATAIRVVASGRRYVTETVGELMANGLGSSTMVRHPHEYLSEREFQLFIHFARGQGPTEIGDQLSLSPGTVSNYRTRLLEKLGLRNNSALTHYAMVHGLLD